MNIERWAERIYAERDFGRGVATSVAGTLGLAVYLITDDWVIAAFSTFIAFPIARILASAVHESYMGRRRSDTEKRRITELYSRLSPEEKEVLRAFVRIGGSVMSWGHANRVGLHEPAVSSLMQREVLYSTMTADGMHEAFGITTEMFDVAQEAYAQEADF